MFVCNKFILFMSLFLIVEAVVSRSIPMHDSPEISTEDDDVSGVRKNVPFEEEMEFYRFANRIDPDALRMLMGSNMTEEPYSPQTPSPYCCYNGGTCHVPTHNPEDRWCSCFSNFTGRYCDMDVDECLFPSACDEHQLCVNTYGSYKCVCDQGFVEQDHTCLRKTDCLDDPCLNFADCIDKEDGRIICICRLGYSGERCENRIPGCDDSSCSDGEICVGTPKGFECVKIPLRSI